MWNFLKSVFNVAVKVARTIVHVAANPVVRNAAVGLVHKYCHGPKKTWILAGIYLVSNVCVCVDRFLSGSPAYSPSYVTQEVSYRRDDNGPMLAVDF